MSSILQTFILTALAVLPGALYTWSLEQQVGSWGATATDRAQRFLGASAVFLVFELPLFYHLIYRRIIITGDIENGRDLSWWVWLAPIIYVLAPVMLGYLVGQAARARKRWARIFTGPNPAPRAWDHLFLTKDLSGFIRLRLKDGAWILGSWGYSEKLKLQSYASGYPEAQDLFISDLVTSDEDGRFLTNDEGNVIHTGGALLIRWEEIAYAEFIPESGGKDD